MNAKIVKGKYCGTCLMWGQSQAINSRTGALMPNALKSCMANIDIPNSFPFSIQKISTHCEDGKNCQHWDGVDQEMEVLTY